MDARTAVLKYVCPSLGAAIAFCMFISPLRSVLLVDKTKQLGALNPLPYAAMAANGLVWVVYGVVIHDYFVFGTNVSGLLLGLFYTMTCYKYSSDKAQNLMRAILLAVCALFLIMTFIHMVAGLSSHGKVTLWGSTAVGIMALYYIAPLSTLYYVFKQRDSSSLQRPLLLANMCNGILWFCYGIAIIDWFIICPNGIGAAFSLICVIISFIVPRHRHRHSSSSSKRDGSSSTKATAAANSAELLPITGAYTPGAAAAGDTKLLAAAAAAAAVTVADASDDTSTGVDSYSQQYPLSRV